MGEGVENAVNSVLKLNNRDTWGFGVTSPVTRGRRRCVHLPQVHDTAHLVAGCIRGKGGPTGPQVSRHGCWRKLLRRRAYRQTRILASCCTLYNYTPMRLRPM